MMYNENSWYYAKQWKMQNACPKIKINGTHLLSNYCSSGKEDELSIEKIRANSGIYAIF